MRLMSLAVLWASVGVEAAAADLKCTGNRVERAGVTQYTVRRSGTEVSLEKGGSPRGRALKQDGGYLIEVNGAFVATLENGHIYRGRTYWGSVAEAQRFYDCPDPIAATLWVLKQTGEL